jgi:urease accessory protein
MTPAALLLLADARFPTGAHAHSGGIEAAHSTGDVHDLDSLGWFIAGRLATTALVDATFTAAACRTAGSTSSPGTSRDDGEPWRVLDAELAARIPSPRMRTVGRALGRQLLRAGERAWPSPVYAELRQAIVLDPFQPIALGAVAAAAGLGPEDAALCALHHQIGTWTTAAVRLLGLDPFAVHALAARLASALESLAAEAAALALQDPADLPSTSSPLGDILAEHHATWEVRLFAS